MDSFSINDPSPLNVNISRGLMKRGMRGKSSLPLGFLPQASRSRAGALRREVIVKGG
jgi:hypothetical protein